MLVDQDECWFSRFAQPQMHTFAKEGTNLRLVQRDPAKKEANKAIACFGAVCDQTKERYFSLAEGQPNSAKSIAFLASLLDIAQARCKRVLIVIWDQASWHKSKWVKQWVRQHNQQAKLEEQGVRLLAYLLPSKSPWLNPMEPIWLHEFLTDKSQRVLTQGQPGGGVVGFQIVDFRSRANAHFSGICRISSINSQQQILCLFFHCCRFPAGPVAMT